MKKTETKLKLNVNWNDDEDLIDLMSDKSPSLAPLIVSKLLAYRLPRTEVEKRPEALT